MKRLLLLSLISVLILTSCGDTSQPETTTAVETDAETTESDDYGYIDPGLEKKDYNGKIFNILYPEWSLYNAFVGSRSFSTSISNGTRPDTSIPSIRSCKRS